jgi:tetratricopeptide (TPR) repeat protein
VAEYNVVHLDDIERASYLGSNLIPVRYTLDFWAAGTNAWEADAGGQLIPPHTEDSGSEEMYVVVRGRAKFTVGDETADGPPGTVVYVPPEVFRTAEAEEDGTVVLAVGGIIGQPFRGGNWDTFAIADSYRRSGRQEEGRAVLHKAIEERPDQWALQYNTACWEVLAGNPDAAFEHLRRAVEMNPEGARPYLAEDSDLDPLRNDPRWEELTK